MLNDPILHVLGIQFELDAMVLDLLFVFDRVGALEEVAGPLNDIKELLVPSTLYLARPTLVRVLLVVRRVDVVLCLGRLGLY